MPSSYCTKISQCAPGDWPWCQSREMFREEEPVKNRPLSGRTRSLVTPQVILNRKLCLNCRTKTWWQESFPSAPLSRGGITGSWRMEGDSIGLGKPRTRSWLYPGALWPWTNSLASLCLNFLTCKSVFLGIQQQSR